MVKPIFRFGALNTLTAIISLLVLMGCLISLSFISPQFEYFTPWLNRPTYLAVGLMVLAGMSYLVFVAFLTTQNSVKENQYSSEKLLSKSLLAIFLAGLVLRLVFVGSTPIYEDDFYRYFFDGQLVNHGVSPYQYAPQQALTLQLIKGASELGINTTLSLPDTNLDFIANEPLVERVAYPHLHTIYPPVAQVFFALSSFIKPFSLEVWRGLLIVVDVITLLLIVQLLRAMGKPVMFSAIYWLNPLLITETVNAAHMDVLILPFVLLSLLMAHKQRFAYAGLCLALAVGIKIWPLILAPILFRPLLFQPKRLFKAALPFLGVSALLLSPQLLSSHEISSGLVSYAYDWRTNSFIFGLLEDGLLIANEQNLIDIVDPTSASRYLTALIIIVIGLALSLKAWESTHQLTASWLWITAALFLLSPTGYPWYFIWLLPFLTLLPSKFNATLLCLVVSLPLYDLRYPLQSLNQQWLFSNVIIAIEFLPVLLMLCFLGVTALQRENIQSHC